MVLTEMPLEASLRPSSASSPGDDGPTLARPSDNRMTRLTLLSETELLDLAAAFLDAGVKRRRAVGCQVVDGVAQLVARVAQRRRGAQDVDLVVVGDERDDVVGRQPLQRHARAFLGGGDAVALHRAGAVDDDGDVDRRAPARASRRQGS